MKKTFTTILMALLLCICTVFGLASCGANQEDIDNAVNPITEQIATINDTLAEVQGYIDDLESKVASLESELATVNTALEGLDGEIDEVSDTLTAVKTELESEIETLKSEIAALKAKGTELQTAITNLETALSTATTATEDWAEATFATIASCNTLKEEIDNSISSLDGRVKTLETSVSTLSEAVTALQKQVEANEQNIDELEKAVESNNEKIAELENSIEDLQNQINCLKEIHEYEYTDNVDGTHTTTCEHCDYSATNEHTYDGDGVCACENEGFDYDTTTNTYTVYSAYGLYAWNTATQSDLSTNLTLKADISLSTDGITVTDGIPSDSNWERVGTDSYTGTVDGNGHTITGLRMNDTSNAQGFIAFLDTSGCVKNLTFADAVITGNSYSAVVVHSNRGTIENCHVTSNSIVTRSDGYVGGICGNNIGTIIGCTNAATVTSNGSLVGGVVVYNIGTIAGCINYGNIYGVNSVGGIAGQLETGAATPRMVACANYGEVTATGYCAGGLVGLASNCYLYGSWTVDCTEKDDRGDARSEDGVGSTYFATVTACKSFASKSAVTTNAITEMNAAITTYNEDAAVQCNYTWVAAEDGYLTLQKATDTDAE